MMIDDRDKAVKLIFAKYDDFCKKGKKPRVILVPKGLLEEIEDDWMDINDINYKKKDYRVPSQPDAIMFGIMVIEVTSIKDIKIF